LDKFHVRRIENLSKPEDERDTTLIEYGRLTQQGTNDLQSMIDRSKILTRYFLQENPDVLLKDTSRQFSEEERFVIWVKSGKMCQATGCGKQLPELADMHADHKTAWSKGGPTSLSNAQALCEECNLKKSNKPAK
jgi:5-methylcytosine-specific restriction endonuclease McrA